MGEMHGDSNVETFITICKIDSKWEFAVWLRLCNNLGGWKRKGDKREVQEGGDNYYWFKLIFGRNLQTKFYKAIILQLKEINKIFKMIKINTYPSKILQKNCRGRKNLKFILLGHHHWYKNQTKIWQKRKL